METLVRRGITLDGNLFISKNAHLIMPYHPALDRAPEGHHGEAGALLETPSGSSRRGTITSIRPSASR
jgi:adenylosuccinate synthase